MNNPLIRSAWFKQSWNWKRDSNEFIMLSDSYLYDKLDNALSGSSFILFENDLPVYLVLKN